MNQEDRNEIQFDLLGVFTCGGMQDTVKNSTLSGRAGKKALSFLQYLIVNHARHISAEELIGQFWAEERSSDPANSLKNMICKIRKLLKEIYPEKEGLLITLPGCYAWAPAVEMRLDTETLEALCVEARKQPEEDCMETLLSATALYRGDFLSGNDDDWAIPQRRYYQTLYLDACRLVLPMLEKKERWTEIVAVCKQACTVDCSAEIFTVYQMQAFISMGNPERALEVYETFRKLLWEEFGIEPGEQVEQVHMLAESMCKNRMRDCDILKLVAEGGNLKERAFLCSFSIFQNIVALERQNMTRSGHTSCIALVSLGNEAVPSTDARRLERILLTGLRTADPVARLDASTYISLLIGADPAGAQSAMARIDRMFHRTYTRSKANISYKIAVLQVKNTSAENF